MFQMMGVFAEFERAMIQERVRAGLARAKAEGKRLGRPKVDEATEDAVRRALQRKNRPGILKIAKLDFGQFLRGFQRRGIRNIGSFSTISCALSSMSFIRPMLPNVVQRPLLFDQ